MTDIEELLRQASGSSEHRVDVDGVVRQSAVIRRRRTLAQVGTTLTLFTAATVWLLTSAGGTGQVADTALTNSTPGSNSTLTPTEPTAPPAEPDTIVSLEPERDTTASSVSGTDVPLTPTPTSPAQSNSSSGPTTEANSTPGPQSTAAGSPPLLSGEGFELIDVEAVPASLRRGNLTSATAVRVFNEAEARLLAEPIVATGFVQGERFNGLTRRSVTVPSGTSVCVWFVHGEIGEPGILRATIDFDQPILALALHADAGLDATRDFAIAGTTYFYDGAGETDEFTIIGSTLELKLQMASEGKDQIRVLTAC